MEGQRRRAEEAACTAQCVSSHVRGALGRDAALADAGERRAQGRIATRLSDEEIQRILDFMRQWIVERVRRACSQCKGQGVGWLTLGELIRTFVYMLEEYEAQPDPPTEFPSTALVLLNKQPSQEMLKDYFDTLDGKIQVRNGPKSSLPTFGKGLLLGSIGAISTAPFNVFSFTDTDRRLAQFGEGIRLAFQEGTLTLSTTPNSVDQLGKPWLSAPGTNTRIVNVLAALMTALYASTKKEYAPHIATTFDALVTHGYIDGLQEAIDGGGQSVVDVTSCAFFESDEIKKAVCEVLIRLGYRRTGETAKFFFDIDSKETELRFDLDDFNDVFANHDKDEVYKALDALFGLEKREWTEENGQFRRSVPPVEERRAFKKTLYWLFQRIAEISLITYIRAFTVMGLVLYMLYNVPLSISLSASDLNDLTAMSPSKRAFVAGRCATGTCSSQRIHDLQPVGQLGARHTTASARHPDPVAG